MSKLVLNVKYLLLLSLSTVADFYNLGRIQDSIRLPYSKVIIFNDLYYFQI
jgi:hypothetical protein